MFDAYQEHCDYHYASDTELDRAEADEIGYANPDDCWVSTNRDVWHKNPYFKGYPTPHPESFGYDEEEDAQIWAEYETAKTAWEKSQAQS